MKKNKFPSKSNISWKSHCSAEVDINERRHNQPEIKGEKSDFEETRPKSSSCYRVWLILLPRPLSPPLFLLLTVFLRLSLSLLLSHTCEWVRETARVTDPPSSYDEQRPELSPFRFLKAITKVTSRTESFLAGKRKSAIMQWKRQFPVVLSRRSVSPFPRVPSHHDADGATTRAATFCQENRWKIPGPGYSHV